MGKSINNTILYFHIGRGGTFNNSGIMSFHGDKNIQEVLNICDSAKQWSFFSTRDEKGRFITPSYFDQNGNFLITEKEVNSGIGKLDWDGDYDTDVCMYLRDCGERELLAIFKSDEFNKEELIKEYFDECTDLNVDWKNFNRLFGDLITDYFQFSDCDINQYYINTIE